MKTFLLLLIATTSVAQEAKYVPPPGKTLVFIGGGVGQPHFNAFHDITGKNPSGQNLWIFDMDPSGVWFQGKPPDRALFIHLTTNYEKVLAGDYDDKIREIGDAIQAIDRPVYVDIAAEAEGTPPEPYKKMFRKIHTMWHYVPNVSYVMHLSCAENPSFQFIENQYPGDDYVDLLATSFYGPGNVAGAERLATFARQHRKGFGIAECGGNFVLRGTHKNWNLYWKHLFAFVKRTNAQFIVYLNCDDHLPTADHFLMMSPPVRSAWKQEMAKPRYVLDHVYQTIGFKDH